MSARELRSLGSMTTVASRLRSGTSAESGLNTMVDETEGDSESREVQELQQKLLIIAEELEAVRSELTAELQQAKQETETERQRAAELEREVDRLSTGAASELDAVKMRMELDRLRQVEELRRQFDRERDQHRCDREGDAKVIQDLKKELAAEKRLAAERAATLRRRTGTPRSSASSESPSESESEPELVGSGNVNCEIEVGGRCSGGSHGGDVCGPTTAGVGGAPSSVSNSLLSPGATASGSGPTSQPQSSTSDNSLMHSIAQLVKTQTDIMVAQTQAMSAQSLPPIPHFSGEGNQSGEESFDRWLEQFEERSKLAGWTEEHKRYHLKMSLDRSAFQTYRLLPKTVQASYTETIAALKKHFQPIDIEELRGVEFHQLMQKDWSDSGTDGS